MAVHTKIDSFDDCATFEATYPVASAQVASNIRAYAEQWLTMFLGGKKTEAALLLAAIKDNADTAEDYSATLAEVVSFKKGLATPVPTTPVEVPVVVVPELPAPIELPAPVEPTPEA